MRGKSDGATKGEDEEIRTMMERVAVTGSDGVVPAVVSEAAGGGKRAARGGGATGPLRRRGAGGWLRVTLTLVAVGFLTVFVVIPAANVFREAFGHGVAAYQAVFYPPPVDAARQAVITQRLGEIEALPLSQRRKLSDERRALQREENEMAAPAERARKNWSAIRMTVGIAAVVVPLNVGFGVAAAWAIAKFRFKGRSLLVSMIDLPFSVSPVIAGLIFVLVFGAQGFLAAWSKSAKLMWLAPAVRAARWLPLIMFLALVAYWALGWVVRRVWSDWREQTAVVRRLRWGVVGAVALVQLGLIAGAYFGTNPGWSWLLPTEWRWPEVTSLYWRGFSWGQWWPVGATAWREGVIFTPVAIVMASVFVTFPFVARSLIPLMETQGVEQEQAAVTLGASGWYTFRRVTLPSIKWGLLYGAILCTGAVGEFGAVSVVSGHLDSNDTMPLRIEKLWQGYQTQLAFAVASLLAMLAVVTLVLKSAIEWKTRKDVVDEVVKTKA